MQKKKPEILAPAGSVAGMKAAVAAAVLGQEHLLTIPMKKICFMLLHIVIFMVSRSI